MDLNVAVAAELFDNNDMVFPILMGREKVSLASPGSESSGVSSLDAEEAKKLANEQLTTSNSPELTSETSSPQNEGESSDETNEHDQSSDEEQLKQKSNEFEEAEEQVQEQEQEQRSVADIESEDIIEESQDIVKIADETESEIEHPKTEEVLLDISQTDTKAHEISAATEDELEEIRYKNLKVIYGGRDILDLASNLNRSYDIQYTHLPDNNVSMYLANRSQYHRLGAGWGTYECKNALCRRCGFRYPIQIHDEQIMRGAAKVNALETTSHNNLCNAINLNHLLKNSTINNGGLLRNMNLSPTINPVSPNMNNMPMNKFPTSSTPLPTSGQMFNNNNLMNNSSNQQSYAYQNQMALPPPNNNMSPFKHNATPAAAPNSFYGNNMTLNAMISQMAQEANVPPFNQNQFMNGGGNGTNFTQNINQMANNLNTTAILNQLMNQNRQNQSGMCRSLANKSGITINGNSHNKMSAYKWYSPF